MLVRCWIYIFCCVCVWVFEARIDFHSVAFVKNDMLTLAICLVANQPTNQPTKRCHAIWFDNKLNRCIKYIYTQNHDCFVNETSLRYELNCMHLHIHLIWWIIWTKGISSSSLIWLEFIRQIFVWKCISTCIHNKHTHTNWMQR